VSRWRRNSCAGSVIVTYRRHSGARAKRVNPESRYQLGVSLWIPDRRFAASGMTKKNHQYVARPPEMSNTAPVENEHSAEAQNATREAISSTSTKRPRGIFDNM
jgi:hypothetical protein